VQNQSEVQHIEDLRGRVLAVPFHSSAHGMVMRSLNATNLLGQIKLTSLEHSAERFDFSAQPADGYAHFAPFHDIACRQGKFRYLLDNDSDHLPAFYGVVVSDELAQYPEVVVAYLQALVAAQYWYDTTPAAPALVSQWTRLEGEIVAQILHSSSQSRQGRFFSETTIRPDWLKLHIRQLSQIPGNEALKQIDLDKWIQPEFLQSLKSH
jgi:NitT/TauT family transport system substrate-binding protein